MIVPLLCFLVGVTVGGGISLFEKKKRKEDKERNEWLNNTFDGKVEKKNSNIHL